MPACRRCRSRAGAGAGGHIGKDRQRAAPPRPRRHRRACTALACTGYTTDGVRAMLGPGAHAALSRGEVEPAFRATRDGGEPGVLVRLLLLGAVEGDAAAVGLLRAADVGWVAALDLRPYGDSGGDWWVLSDLDRRRQLRHHVTGIGAALLTLATATVRRPQAFRAVLMRAPQVRRAASCSTARGWSRSPGAGSTRSCRTRRSSRAPRLDYVYRDSGQDGDAALASPVRALAAYLSGRDRAAARVVAARAWRGLAGPGAILALRRRRRLGRAARGGRPGTARRHVAARRRRVRSGHAATPPRGQ